MWFCRTPSLVAFLDALLQRMGSKVAGATIAGISYEVFRRRLQRGLAAVGCVDLSFTSHSLRRGAATTLAQAGYELQTIMILGRWSSLSSCRLYLRAGDAELIALRRKLAGPRAHQCALLAGLGVKVFSVSEINSTSKNRT